MPDIKKQRFLFNKFRQGLNEALFRDEGIKVNFYYGLDSSFNDEDLKQLKKSVNYSIFYLQKLKTELYS